MTREGAIVADELTSEPSAELMPAPSAIAAAGPLGYSSGGERIQCATWGQTSLAFSGVNAASNGTYILNNATTSSVLTKLSISGCTCRSMYSRRSGRIVIGPERDMSTGLDNTQYAA